MSREVDLLLIEDNLADARLFEEIMLEHNPGARIQVARDGAEAIERVLGQQADTPVELIVLDLNLPRVNGLEVLKALKADPRSRTIPVIVLTTSQAPSDIQQAYDLHAAAYLVKPAALDEFERQLAAINTFWLGVCILPSDTGGFHATASGLTANPEQRHE